ncbi:unnamed protein product [Toxocara canis]|uniref:M-phase inducer phosphatase n=1 Tax=Toxocara canis TaxID=6265 RepID=A0A183V731_TOXCA|nr:unnamed protein product [Toxocara canis]
MHASSRSESLRCNQFYEEDTDSRDSGVCMEIDTPTAENDFSSIRKHSWLQKMSEQRDLPDLIEEMEEVALNESLNDLTEAEKETEQQLRRLSEKARFLTTPRKALGDVTNSLEFIESPKTHIGASHHLHEVVQHSQSSDSMESLPRHASFCEAKIRRKRFCRAESLVEKRRREVICSMLDENEECDSGQLSISLMRVQSTGYIESGRYARDLLPELLHVDYSLRTISKPQIDSVAFKSIDGTTLAELMDSMDVAEFTKKFVIVDCRYPYEYNGGHIRGAINLHDPSLLQEVFYPSSSTQFGDMLRRIPVFYCEYSQKRGPAMAAALRQYDRCRNEARYPDVDYKEIYVLDRGYRKFFKQDGFARLCDPPGYVPMIEPSYRNELKRFKLHKTKSFGGLSSCFRPGGGAENGPRRIRLTFRSASEDASPKSRTLDTEAVNLFRSPEPTTSAELYGSPFPHPSTSETPPQTKEGPIQMADFS